MLYVLIWVVVKQETHMGKFIKPATEDLCTDHVSVIPSVKKKKKRKLR